MWSEGGYYYDAAYAISEPLPFNEKYLSFGYGKLSFRTNVVSPENTNYNLSTLSLIFMVNNPVVWMGYSLNGQDNATVIGNTMLSIFPTAFTPLRFYARDEFGNTGDSEIVGFTTKEAFSNSLIHSNSRNSSFQRLRSCCLLQETQTINILRKKGQS